jgi:hypothetical protein
MRFDHFAMTFALFAIQPPSGANPANPANRHPKPLHLAGTLGVFAKNPSGSQNSPCTPLFAPKSKNAFLNHSQTATNTLGSARTVTSKKIIIKFYT